MKANWICLEGAGCGTIEVNNTAQLRGRKAASQLPLPQSLSNPTSLPKYQQKGHCTSVHWTTQRKSAFWICNWVFCYFKRLFYVLCFLTCCASSSARQDVLEGLGSHPQLYTLVTTGKCAATSFHTESVSSESKCWNIILIPCSPSCHHWSNSSCPSFLNKKATMNLCTLLSAPQPQRISVFCYHPSSLLRNAGAHLHILWTVFHYWK